VPLIPRGRVEKLVLMHLEFQSDVSRQKKVGILQDLRQRYENLKSLVTERDVVWRDEYLDPLPVEDLILVPVKDLAIKIVEGQKAKV
jgi:hypothetical protein